MVINNVSINVEYWKGKTFEEFEKAFKGKIRSDKIKSAYESFKVVKPKKVEKPKEEKKK